MDSYTTNISDVIHKNIVLSQVLIPNTILIVIGVFLSIFGNVVVMFIHWKKLNSSENFRILIPYLALSDCIASIVCSGIAVYRNYHWLTLDNEAMCKAACFFMALVQTNSAVFLFFIAVQRYKRINYPLKRASSPKKRLLWIIIAALYLVAESVPFIFFSDVVSYREDLVNGTMYDCRMLVNYEDVHTVYRYVDDAFIIVLVIIVTILYTKSGLVLSKLSQNALKSDNGDNMKRFIGGKNSTDEVSSSSGNLDSNNMAENWKRTKMTKSKCRKYRNINIMFITITIISVLAYTPRVVFNVIDLHSTEFWRHLSYTELRIVLVWKRLYLAMYVVNPFIYSIMDHKFRIELKKLFTCRTSDITV